MRYLPILLVLPLLLGATYYVRTDGNDACNGLTDAAGSSGDCGFATIQACIDAATNNDTCLVGAGTYTSCPEDTWTGAGPGGNEDREAIASINGFSGFTLKGGGSTAGTVTLQSTELVAGDWCDYAIGIYNSSSVTVGGLGANEGFTITGLFDSDSGGGADDNSGANAFYTTGMAINLNDSTAITVQGMDITHADTVGGWTSSSELGVIGGNEQSQLNTLIEGNTVRSRRAKYGIFFPGGDDCTVADSGCTADNLTIRGNQVYYDAQTPFTSDWRFIGFYTKACGDCIIEDNFFQCGTPTNYWDGSGDQSGGNQCIYLRADQRNIVRNNYIEMYGVGQAIYCHNNPDTTETHKFYNNTIYGGGRACMWLESCDGGTEVRNNVCQSHDTGDSNLRWQDFAQMSSGFVGNMGYNGIYNVTTPYSDNATCELAASGQCDDDGTNVYTDLLLNLSGDKPTPHFQISLVSSPLVGAGSLDADAPSDDYEGDARGAAYDIGADEFVTGTSTAATGVVCSGVTIQ